MKYQKVPPVDLKVVDRRFVRALFGSEIIVTHCDAKRSRSLHDNCAQLFLLQRIRRQRSTARHGSNSRRSEPAPLCLAATMQAHVCGLTSKEKPNFLSNADVKLKLGVRSYRSNLGNLNIRVCDLNDTPALPRYTLERTSETQVGYDNRSSR